MDETYFAKLIQAFEESSYSALSVNENKVFKDFFIDDRVVNAFRGVLQKKRYASITCYKCTHRNVCRFFLAHKELLYQHPVHSDDVNLFSSVFYTLASQCKYYDSEVTTEKGAT